MTSLLDFIESFQQVADLSFLPLLQITLQRLHVDHFRQFGIEVCALYIDLMDLPIFSGSIAEDDVLG